MENIFSKLKRSLATESNQALFQRVFLPIRKSHTDLAKDLAAFCATGEPAGVLLRAEHNNDPDMTQSFGLMTSTRYHWIMGQKNQGRPRRLIYKKLAAGKLAPEMVVRMGKAFAAMLHNNLEKHTHDGFPDWLHVILADWMVACGDNDQSRKPSMGNQTIPLPGVHTLSRLCESDALHPATWLHFFFDRKATGSYWGFENHIIQLRQCSGLKDFISMHHDHIVAAIAPELAAAGLAQCLIEIGELKCTGHFTDFVINQAVDSRKTVQRQALRLMVQLPEEHVLKGLARFLDSGRAGQRKQAAEALGRLTGDKGRSLLESARATESSKTVVAAIDVALGATAIREEAVREAPLDIPDYPRPNLDSQVDAALVDRIENHIRELQIKYKEMKAEYAWQKTEKKRILGLSRTDAGQIVHMMNGRIKPKYQWHRISRLIDTRLLEDRSIDLIHIMRLYGKPPGARDRYLSLDYGPLPLWLKRQPAKLTDLRPLADVLHALRWPGDFLKREILHNHWRQSFLVRDLPRNGVWPYFAQRSGLLAETIIGHGGASNRWEGVSLDRVFEVLALFPNLPRPVKAPLLQLALGEGKTYRPRAQALLGNLPGIESKVAAALKSNTQEARMNASRWLARIGSTTAIAPLKAALEKESREPVRATLLSALETLGEDISELLHPESLLKEARKGLKKKMPKGLSWFPFDGLPALKWRDGLTVDPDIPRWWVVLACKLKDPGGNELILKYLQRLDDASRQALGLYMLRSFIARDTRCPTMAEAEEKAAQQAPNLLKTWQQWAKYEWAAAYRNKTLEDAHAEIRRQVLGTYLGSAIREKGILALSAHADGADTVPMLRAYMKDHYTRRHQIEAMLRAAAPGNDSHVIQLLLAVARRHRTRSVQNAAGELVEQIAERNGWSKDELADRTIPTAGFDDHGRMVLEYGSRQLTVTLSDKLTPVLTNETGKTIKTLPAARQADDETLVKEAKKRFSACKKELKQVMQLTTGRFYEAMCAERRWPAADWAQYVYAHPIANRLIQRLVWIHDARGRRVCFRPAEDGALLTVADDEIEVPQSGKVSLAHRSVLTDADTEAWQAHLKDYKVKPLFEQFDRPGLGKDIDLEKTRIHTYEGYLSDAFTLRGILTKLGYQRGEAEDGGFFYFYSKYFESVNLQALIFFTGNCLPEENVPAALQQMGFCTRRESGWFNEQEMQPLKSVPPVLLSEVMADYKAAADKTGGYDADWKTKAAW